MGQEVDIGVTTKDQSDCSALTGGHLSVATCGTQSSTFQQRQGRKKRSQIVWGTRCNHNLWQAWTTWPTGVCTPHERVRPYLHAYLGLCHDTCHQVFTSYLRPLRAGKSARPRMIVKQRSTVAIPSLPPRVPLPLGRVGTQRRESKESCAPGRSHNLDPSCIEVWWQSPQCRKVHEMEPCRMRRDRSRLCLNLCHVDVVSLLAVSPLPPRS